MSAHDDRASRRRRDRAAAKLAQAAKRLRWEHEHVGKVTPGEDVAYLVTLTEHGTSVAPLAGSALAGLVDLIGPPPGVRGLVVDNEGRLT